VVCGRRFESLAVEDDTFGSGACRSGRNSDATLEASAPSEVRSGDRIAACLTAAKPEGTKPLALFQFKRNIETTATSSVAAAGAR